MATLHKIYPIPLPDPLRLYVLKRITGVMDGITIANGYAHDLNGKVFRGRALFGEGDPIPMLSILEVPIPVDQLPSPGSESKGGWELMVQGFAPDDRDNPTDPAHLLLADVKKCFGLEKQKENWDKPQDGIFGLGGIVDKMYIGTGVVRPADEISAKAYFWLTITLDIVEDLADPYNA